MVWSVFMECDLPFTVIAGESGWQSAVATGVPPLHASGLEMKSGLRRAEPSRRLVRWAGVRAANLACMAKFAIAAHGKDCHCAAPAPQTRRGDTPDVAVRCREAKASRRRRTAERHDSGTSRRRQDGMSLAARSGARA
ncbi:hypothetical protein WME76_13700 [Sorangium sp. So ce119]|uniref:hypothetical protein n=1 Tax=Sorangium sp. So ce119 TaxID=3133279 RepID=UPI003F5FEE74